MFIFSNIIDYSVLDLYTKIGTTSKYVLARYFS